MLQVFINSISQGLLPSVFKFLIIILPIFIPILLVYLVWVIRYRWVTMKFIDRQKTCLLEIKLPKEITKSPAAMEIFFSYFFQSGAANYGEAFLDGRTRPWFSCELVSIGGEVKFFIWCSLAAKFKNVIEAQLYAQYPNVEIYEVSEDKDYTKAIRFDKDKYFIFGLQYALTKPDPYPIKSYIDYGLDKDQKDEYKVDPMTAVLEFLGTMKKGENVWIQIMIRKHEKESWKHGRLRKGKDLKTETKGMIEQIRQEAIPKTTGEDTFKFPNPTKGQIEIIAALERVSNKPAFDCMIRSMYITEKDSFNIANIGGTIGSLRQFSSNTLNGFKPGFITDISDGAKDLARVIPFLKRFQAEEITAYKKDLLHAYKLRSFFEWPYKNLGGDKPFVLTTEELATIFHFPSVIVSQTPTLTRVPSKKSEAPANLPI